MTKSFKRRCDQLSTLALTHLKDVNKVNKVNNVIFLFLQTSTNIVEMVLVAGKICKQLTLTVVSMETSFSIQNGTLTDTASNNKFFSGISLLKRKPSLKNINITRI